MSIDTKILIKEAGYLRLLPYKCPAEANEQKVAVLIPIHSSKEYNRQKIFH